jgi:predicted amidophosphoribosyltransferase
MLDVLLPENCVLCGLPPRNLCSACLETLTPQPQWQRLDNLWLCHAGAPEQPTLVMIRAFKDEFRTGLSKHLARLVAPAVHAATERFGRPDAFVVPPSPLSSWRRRGFVPMHVILRRVGITPYRALARSPEVLGLFRRRRDQRGLTIEQRALNVAGAFRPRHNLAGARVMIVDDVVTTGATLAEAVRALEFAGASVVCAVAMVRVAPRRKK